MKKPKKKLIIIITAIALIFVLLIAGLVSCVNRTVKQIDSFSGVLVEPLAKQDLSTSISVSGKIESQSKVSVTSDLTYKIAELKVAVGDYVNQGDVLCVFDSSELNAQIKSLEEQLQNSDSLNSKQTSINNRALSEAKSDQQDQLAAASASIDKASSNLDKAKAYKAQLESTYNDYQSQIANIKNLLSQVNETDDNYASLTEQLSQLTISAGELLSQINEADSGISSCQDALDEAKTNYSSVEKTTNQQIQAAQDSIDTQTNSSDNDARTELESLKRKLDKITVKAEHSGIITSLNVQTGSIHAGGELMTIQDTNALKLTVSIKESDILKLKEGMSAIVSGTANEDLEIKGTVTKVVDFASTSTNENGESTNGYSAEITLPDNSGMLLGMSAKAKILTSEENESIAAAYDSIFEEDGENYVYRANPVDNGKYKIEKIKVTKGVDSDYYTQISSSELSEGDYIVSYPDEVSEGDIVSVDESYMTYNEDGE